MQASSGLLRPPSRCIFELFRTRCGAPVPIKRHASTSRPTDPEPDDATWPYELFTSSRITDRKSSFLAHATKFPDPSALPQLLNHLRDIPRLNCKRATHCMYAFRASGTEGQSDGGEGGSGDRLARLVHTEDVVVVVWRWYGGVKLGADRWKCISQVAKEALDAGGFRGQKGAVINKGNKIRRTR